MKEIQIGIDKRTEVMSVLLYISNYRKEFPNLINYNRDILYINDVFETFSKFSGHKTVLLLNEIIEKLPFSYDAPYVLSTQLNNDFTKGELLPYPYENRLKSSAVVVKFMDSVKDFVKDSKFEEFFAEHQKAYDKWIEEFKATIRLDYLSKFEEFFGIELQKNYIINLLPMTAYNGMYYDYRNGKDFVIHFRNRGDSCIRFDGNGGNTARIFNIFATSLIREMIEKQGLNVPMCKDFEDILKTKYTASTNLQYICGEVSAVLESIFHNEVCQNGEKRRLENIYTNHPERVKKVFEIFENWRNGKSEFCSALQEVLDLY